MVKTVFFAFATWSQNIYVPKRVKDTLLESVRYKGATDITIQMMEGSKYSTSQNTNQSDEEFAFQEMIEDTSFVGNLLGERRSKCSTTIEMDKSEINPILQNTDQSKKPDMKMSEDDQLALDINTYLPILDELHLEMCDLEENLNILNEGNNDIICKSQNLLKTAEQELQQEEKKFDINCDKNSTVSLPNVVRKINCREQWEQYKEKFINKELQRQMITNVNKVSVEMTNINDKRSELRKQYEYLQFIAKKSQNKTNKFRVAFEMCNKQLEQYEKKLKDVKSMLQQMTNAKPFDIEMIKMNREKSELKWQYEYCQSIAKENQDKTNRFRVAFEMCNKELEQHKKKLEDVESMLQQMTNAKTYDVEMININDKKSELRRQYEYLQSIVKKTQDKTNRFRIAFEKCNKGLEQRKKELKYIESKLQRVTNTKTLLDIEIINFNDRKKELKWQYEYLQSITKEIQDRTNKFRASFEMYNKQSEQYKKALKNVESMLQQTTNAKTFDVETNQNQSSEILNMRPQLITQQSPIDIALSTKSVQLIKSVREQLNQCKEDLKFINSIHQQIITNMNMAIDEMTNIPNKLKENELTKLNAYLMSLIKKNQDEINKIHVEGEMHRNSNKSDVEQKISTCADSLMQETVDTKKKLLEVRELKESDLKNKQHLKMIKEFWRNQEDAFVKRQKYEKENQKILEDKKLREVDVQFKIKRRSDMPEEFCRSMENTLIKHPKYKKKNQKTLEERELEKVEALKFENKQRLKMIKKFCRNKEDTLIKRRKNENENQKTLEERELEKVEALKFENEQRLKMIKKFCRNKEDTLIKRRENENKNQKTKHEEYDSNMQIMKKTATFHTENKRQQRFEENQISPITNEIINENARKEQIKCTTKLDALQHLYDTLEKEKSFLLSQLNDMNSKMESFNTLTSQNSILQEESQQASSEINSKSSDLQILSEQVPKVPKSSNKNCIFLQKIAWKDVKMKKGDYKHITLPTINIVDTETDEAMKSPKQAVNTVSDISSVMDMDTNYVETTENISNKASAKIVKLSEDPKINDKSIVMDEQIPTFTENLNKDRTTSITQKEKNDGKYILKPLAKLVKLSGDPKINDKSTVMDEQIPTFTEDLNKDRTTSVTQEEKNDGEYVLIPPININEEIEEAEESGKQIYEDILPPLDTLIDDLIVSKETQAIDYFLRAMETLNLKSTKKVELEDIQNENKITDDKIKTKKDDTAFEDLIVSLPYYEPPFSNTAKDQSFVKETINGLCQNQLPDDYQLFKNCGSHVKLDNACASQHCIKTLMSNDEIDAKTKKDDTAFEDLIVSLPYHELPSSNTAKDQSFVKETIHGSCQNQSPDDYQLFENCSLHVKLDNACASQHCIKTLMSNDEIDAKSKKGDTAFEDLIVSLPYHEPPSSNTAKDQSFVKETIHGSCQNQSPDDYQLFEKCSSHVKLDNACASQHCIKTLMSNNEIDANMSKNHVKCDYCFLASDILMTVNYNIKNKFQTINNNNNKGHECTLNETTEEESEIEDVTSTDSDTSSWESSINMARNIQNDILKNRTLIARNTSNITRKTHKDEKRFYQNTVKEDQTTKAVEESEIEDVRSTDLDTSSCETSLDIDRDAILENGTLIAGDTSNVARKTYKDEKCFCQNTVEEDQITKVVKENKIEGVTSMNSDTSGCETSYDIDQDAILENGTLIAEDTSNVACKTYKDEKHSDQNTDWILI